MPKVVYYDRRVVDATEVQFFHESRAKHPDKEFGTNMPLDAMWDHDFTIRKIVITVNPKLISSTTAKDAAVDDEVVRMMNDMIVQIQVGDMPVIYLPFDECIASLEVTGSLQYTLATAADGSYSFMSVNKANGQHGLDIDISVPARTTFKFFIRSLSTPNLGKVTVKLFGERP
ncbi:MAG: hypothetical protein QXS32_08405 [Candidatus Nezhaarchaeales archaeon]